MAAKYIVVANWKMHPSTLREARKLFDATRKIAEKASKVSTILAPSSLHLLPLSSEYKGKKLQFAAQNAREGDEGAFTGDISVGQVEDSKAEYLLVGHAERRERGETNDDTRQKVASALAHGLTPILCVGERVRSASGEHFTFVREQLKAGFQSVDPNTAHKVMVAYEPVWAIGSEEAMSPRSMHEMAIFIRKTIVELHGAKGEKLKILYGGAVNQENAAHMLLYGDVVGLLVGRASVDPKEFALLIESVQQNG